MNSPGAPEERELPGVRQDKEIYRSAVAQCEKRSSLHWTSPPGKNYVSDRPGVSLAPERNPRLFVDNPSGVEERRPEITFGNRSTFCARRASDHRDHGARRDRRGGRGRDSAASDGAGREPWTDSR